MSALRFSIIDYTQIISGLPTTTIIDEPVGLDKVTLHINRDKDYHGFSDMVDDSLGKLQFYNNAFSILSAAYHNVGIDARVECLIEFACDDDDTYQTLYQGRFKMDTFRSYEGIDGCYAEVVIENSYYLTMFRNRMSQKVSLDSLQTFDVMQDDGVTPYPPLTPYAALGQEMTLNPMTIRELCYATVDTPIVGSQIFGVDNHGQTGSPGNGLQPNPSSNPGNNPMFFLTNLGAPYTGSPNNNEFNLQLDQNSGGLIVPGACAAVNPFCKVSAQEIVSFPGPIGEEYMKVKASPYETAYHAMTSAVPIFTFQPDIVYKNNTINLDIELSWAMFGGSPDGQGFDDLNVEFQLMKGQTFADAFNNWQVRPNSDGSRGGSNGSTQYSTISGCMIDNKAIHGINLGNGVYDGTAKIYSFNDQYSYHGKVWFNPGDQLYLICNITSHGSIGGSDLQFVFFSDTYEFRNSYQSGANPYTPSNTSTPYTLSAVVNSASTNSGYTVGSTFTPISPGANTKYFKFNIAMGSWTPTAVTQPQSYVRLTFNTQYKETESTVYLVNEALSRLAEIITNDNFRVYSDYFGRTDAEPYLSGSDGPAGLIVITNGLLIRGYTPLLAYLMGYSEFKQTNLSSSITSYTLNLTEEPVVANTSNIVVVTNPAGTVIIIPNNSSVPYPIGFQLIVEQGTGVATIQGDTGVTVYAPASIYSTNGLGSQILLTKVGEDIWLLASRSSLFCSFKELIDALNCIHTAGFAVEDDPSRSGYQRVRVEPIAHFYDSGTVMMTCENVDIVETSADGGSCISEIEIGYAKWEAEQAQGLDEFLTKRVYRTTLNTIRAKWNKLCSFVASGYAIETTRRRLGTNTTDWRYDKDNFIISIVRSGGGFESENGGFVNTPGPPVIAPSGMIDPTSVYNARISPIRNLLRWLIWILPSYADPSTGKLVFTQGEGNYYASGGLATDPIEAAPLHENQTLELSDYASTTNIVYKNELVIFKCPLGFSQWQSIYNTKYGLIKYNVNGDAWRYGFVQELKYDLFEGMGEFTLKTAV